jgi:hypothetical protein
MTTLDEKTKINLHSALYVVAFVISMVSGYFLTMDAVDEAIQKIDNRVIVLEQLQKSAIEDREKDAKRLDEFNANQVKMMVHLGIEPVAPRE